MDELLIKSLYKYMKFKQWFIENEGEYYGFSFLQEPEITNGPAYRGRGVRSKYKGDVKKQKSHLNKIDQMYGFSPEQRFEMGKDEDEKSKSMKKKMKKSK